MPRKATRNVWHRFDYRVDYVRLGSFTETRSVVKMYGEIQAPHRFMRINPRRLARLGHQLAEAAFGAEADLIRQ